MLLLGGLLSRFTAPTAVSAAALVLLVFLVIKIGRVLLMAGIFGAIAAGASFSRGNPGKTAATHGAIAFGAAAVMFFLVKLAKNMVIWFLLTAAGVAALFFFGFGCSRPDTGTVKLPAEAPPQSGDEPPVMVSPESPVEYPPALYAQRIEGKVVLRMFVDTTGTVVPESTRIAESSGYPALDSAALQAAPRFRFAPGLRHGEPVATLFLQPVHFRHPEAGGLTP
jgi:TonB family protein